MTADRPTAVFDPGNSVITFRPTDGALIESFDEGRLPAGDPVTITIATNGMKAVDCRGDDPVRIKLKQAPADTGLVRLRIEADDNREAGWSVRFGR